MESERDSTLFISSIRRKPISPSGALIVSTSVKPSSAEPANTPLLLDQENDFNVAAEAFDHKKQPVSAVGVSPINDQIQSSALNHQDVTTRIHKTKEKMIEKVDLHESSMSESRGGWEKTVRRIIDGWWQEMLCCLVSIVALITLAMTLREFNHKPLPNWPSGITLNTVLACMATICRTALLVPVTEGLAQAKWTWFKKKPRPLKDFEAFDKASRGLGGSLSLLSYTKGWFVGIIAAFLLSTTIATSTITQFAVTYPSRYIEDTKKGSAEAWRLEESWGRDYPDYALNVTHLIEADVDFYHGTLNITLPNGIYTIPGKSRARYTGAPTFFVGSGPTLVHKHLQNASILDYFAIYWEPSEVTPRAAEISFYWCIDTYGPYLVDNVLQMNKSASQIPTLQGRQGDEIHGYLPLVLSAQDDVTYTIGGLSTKMIASHLNESLSGESIVLGGEPIRGTSGSDILVQATKEVLQKLTGGNSSLEELEKEKSWWIAVEGMALNAANSLTNTLLPEESNVDGTSLHSEVYVQVRWEWLALLSAQVALSILLLICIIIESAKAGVEIMKASTAPVLFAISAVEKARMENGGAELDSLRQKKDFQQLAHFNLRKLKNSGPKTLGANASSRKVLCLLRKLTMVE
ncbi:unnamed protein product [Fusarium venenatum]|uniref:Uncharacterized protein n=1 Tax=Fusarium venenatum TaxID=56646 RepID=A0A2L2TRQ2_9HYPO|nr:uncharacterized protein FVRRES_06871 [Fusarium venenatum]CEI62435.1 unnamed protein product [Fusarium venenatum]